MARKNRDDMFRLPADYDGPQPAVNHFDPAQSLCVRRLVCRECGADGEAFLPVWNRLGRGPQPKGPRAR